MSETTASLRHKIGSAGELHSVVRSMKALAASNIGQYEQSVRALAAYFRMVELGLSVCLRSSAAVAPAAPVRMLAQEPVIGAIVFGSDQGLVGRFNEAAVELALKTLAALPGTVRVWAVGERVRARLADAGQLLAGVFSVPNSVKAITPLVGRLLVASEAGRGREAVGELHLFYNRPGVADAYEPVEQRLLPLDEAWRRKRAAITWPAGALPEVVGGATATLRALIREYLFVSLFRACAESLASENASRLAAMRRAEKNIEQLLDSLNVDFHRLRQGAIDEELFDVITGFETLSGARSPSGAKQA